MRNKYTYVWVSLVILVFGIIFIPEIIERIKTGTIIEHDRMNQTETDEPLSFIYLNDEKRKVPSFQFLNQDSLLISEKDYEGKVYILEFFLKTFQSK